MAEINNIFQDLVHSLFLATSVTIRSIKNITLEYQKISPQLRRGVPSHRHLAKQDLGINSVETFTQQKRMKNLYLDKPDQGMNSEEIITDK